MIVTIIVAPLQTRTEESSPLETTSSPDVRGIRHTLKIDAIYEGHNIMVESHVRTPLK